MLVLFVLTLDLIEILCYYFIYAYGKLDLNPKKTRLFSSGTALGGGGGGSVKTHPTLLKIRSRRPSELKLTRVIAYIIFYKICQLKNSTMTNDVITKKMAKFGFPRKPKKLYIIRKVFMKAIQKCTLYWIWIIVSKVMGIVVQFWLSYDARSPNMVMSRTPKCRFRKYSILS